MGQINLLSYCLDNSVITWGLSPGQPCGWASIDSIPESHDKAPASFLYNCR